MLLKDVSPADPLSRLVLEGLEKGAPILKDIQFYRKPGSADSVKNAPSGGTTGIFRSINEDNVPIAVNTDFTTLTKKIVSFEVKTDIVYEDRNEDAESELAYQTRTEAEEAGYILQEKVFEGDVSINSEEFDGFRNLVDVSMVSVVAENGLVIPMGNTDTKITQQQQAIEELLKLFASVRGGASHAYMNEYLKIRWLTIAKNLGYYKTEKDELGSSVEMIGDVIIRGAGYNSSGEANLPFTETVGTATEKCSSIFVVRWGERKDLTALTSAGVKARYIGQSGNFLINNVNLDMTLGLQNKTALIQSKGWRLV